MFYKKTILIVLSFFLQISWINAKEVAYPINLKLSVEDGIKGAIKSEGRLFIFLSTQSNREPRTLTWPTAENYVFAKNINDLNANDEIVFPASEDWKTTSEWSLKKIPEGTYYLQVLWDQDREESGINAPENIYSLVKEIEVNESVEVEISLSEIIGPGSIIDHKFVKEITLKSNTLSDWWGKEMTLKASVLLPGGYYEQPDKKYPVRYNVAGYGGRYTRINGLVKNNTFSDWWFSDDAPQIINVFLDGEGPFGDSYQMDSDNSGPYGYALIHELIPYIETTYRGTGSSKYRFVDGCSTGGWVSLALQLYYPDEFNSVWSYSPDAIEFENYQLINIYKDKNAFINEYGNHRPVARNITGEPMMMLNDFIQYENVLGRSDSYVTSGGQFSAHTALYSLKGDDGLPKPLFDPESGEMDPDVAEHWKKYDLKLYAKEYWTELGPKVQGKIYIWMGDMDHFYLNIATRSFDEFLKTTENPVSDAEIMFTPMKGHCANYSHRKVLEKMAEKLNSLD
ncbi:MAG: hypothetical protein KAQ79_20565 [Cyclobacteriaceae bacterium]|nr:hypothetical protein [Cyclobacteriaceae bacterium]